MGLIAALALARQSLPVHVFEAESKVNDAPRAATTHAATLEILEELGLADEVIRRGLVEPLFRTWDRSTGRLVAEFDFTNLKNDTRYPFAVQCEQHKLANMAIEKLRDFPHATLEFSARVTSISQSNDAVEITVETGVG
ncbi:MAG: FAD-dependent monooxygenase, partial [Xanthobacteraceae bacterium]